jgi:hypothetical protein
MDTTFYQPIKASGCDGHWTDSQWLDSLGPFFAINQERLQAGTYEERDPVSDEGEEELEESVEMEDQDKFQKEYDHVEQAGILHLAHCWQGQGQVGEFVSVILL